jgi:integrator complex subunit 7
MKLIQVLERISHSPGKKQILSLQMLVDMACKLQNKIVSGNDNDPVMLDDLINKIIFDQILSLAEKLNATSNEMTEVDSTEFSTLLGLSLKIIKNNPSAGLFALEKALSVMDVLKKCSANTVKNLLARILRFLNISLSEILENRGVNLDLYPKLKTLVESIQENSYERFCLSINICKTKHGNGFMPSNLKLRICTEIRALRLVKKLVEEGNYWDAYRIGIYSCCEGLWFCADFIFKKLVGVLKSDVYHSWFKFLLLFSASETEIRLLLFPKPGLRLVQELNKEVNSLEEDIVSCEDMDNDNENDDLIVNLCSFEGKLCRVCEMLHSLDQILVSNFGFYLQRWFVSLRMRFLESVIELTRIINKSGSGSENLKDLLLDLFSCTMKLAHMAKEYDLIAISYLEIDSRSLGIISSLALVCSLLAFCTGMLLAFLPPEDVPSFSITPYLEDLLQRLHGFGTETTPHWKELLPPDSELISLFGLFQPRKDEEHFGTFHRDCLSLCEFALSRSYQLRGSFAKDPVKDASRITFLKKGVDFLSEVIHNCVGLNLRLPKCFFNVRYVGILVYLLVRSIVTP